MNAKISIIMPLYGVEAYIARAIESVQQQTFSDWELLIVNDGTKDRSREIAAKYEKHDERIHIIDKPNGGLTSARLKGLEYVQGDFLSFIDCDDTLHPDYLEVLYTNIVRYDADVSMCSYNTVHNGTISPQYLYYSQAITVIEQKDIFERYYLPQIASIRKASDFLPAFMWLRLFRKDVITSDLFVSERDVYMEDVAFSCRIHKRLSRVVVANQQLYNYYVNDGSLTKKYRENGWMMMQNLTHEVEIGLSGYSQEIVSERLQSRVIGALHFAFFNASRLDYNSFKKEFSMIVADRNVHKICREVSLFSIKRAFWAVVLSVRWCTPYIIYKYNKKRL